MSKKKNNDVKVEFCAISKDFVVNKLKEIESKYNELVEENKFWTGVYYSQVNIIDEPESEPEISDEESK